MSAPDMTGMVAMCLGCGNWQIDAPPRARASLGVDGLVWAIGQAVADHQLADHPETASKPTRFGGRELAMADGAPATGGLVAMPLPRWWTWITVAGAR